MAQYDPIQINYNPVSTYPGTSQNNFIGAQSIAGQRGTLPTFSSSNSYFVGGAGASDSNSGTSASPFKTIHHSFDTTASLLLDSSGLGTPNTLGVPAGGPPPILQYPCYPAPAQGNVAVGPFTTTTYLEVPTTLSSAITAAKQFSFECYFYINSLALNSTLFQYLETPTGNNTCLIVNTNGSIQFNVYDNAITLPANSVVTNQWYFVACSYNSTTPLQQVYLNGLSSSSSFVHSTFGTISGHNLGTASTASDPLLGYMDRAVYMNVSRPSFATMTPEPTPRGTSGVIGFYNFETDPLIQSGAKQYVVVQDSALHNERTYVNFPDDLSNVGLYAADGFAPTIQVLRGTVPDSYGAGYPGITFPTPTTADTLFVSYLGSDSTGVRGNSALPFRTITAALSYTNARGGGSTQNGDTVLIQDSNLYHEDLNFLSLTLITVQAANGQTPILKNFRTGSTNYHLQALSTSINFFNGLTLQDSGSGSVVGPGAGFNFTGCTISSASGSQMNFMMQTNTSSLLPGAFSFINCYLLKMTITQPATSTTVTSIIQNFQYSYFKICNLGFLTGTGTGGGIITAYSLSNTFDTCGTVQALFFDPSSGSLPVSFQQCKFLNSTNLQMMALVGTLGGLSYITNCDFQGGNCGTSSFSGITGGGIMRMHVENCLVSSGQFVAETSTSGGTANVFFTNCTVLFAPGGATGAGFYISQTSGTSVIVYIQNCCSIGSASWAIQVASGTVNVAAFLERGSATAPSTGIVIVGTPFNETNANIINGSVGAANSALNPTDNANFGGSNIGLLNIGVESAVAQINVSGFAFNGLIVSGNICEEGGINSPGCPSFPTGTTFNVAFCTFNGLGNYGLKSAQFGQSYLNCVFATNGYGIQLSGQDGTVQNCVFDQCGSAGIGNFGQNNIVTNCTAYGCLYGQYDNFGSFSYGSANLVYAGSGAFDYSGDNLLSYSSVGTLDPSRNGTLDTHSTNLDPLFRNIVSGDYRLQTVEGGYYFNSPAKLGGSNGYDMGAFSFTYGSLSLAWTTLTLTYNPDQLQRSQSVIKLAEGDTEGGNLYSTGVAFQILYKFIWNSNNPMPTGDLSGLTAIYASTAGPCQISFDGGSTWVSVRVVKSQEFDWSDLDDMYNDNQKPTPLREIDFRVSA